MKKHIPDWLIVTLCRALLGEIYPSIRCIAIKYTEEKILFIRYYLDRAPTDMDYESMEVLATDISVETGLDLNLIKGIEIDCQFSSSPIGKIDPLDGFVYARREYDI